VAEVFALPQPRRRARRSGQYGGIGEHGSVDLDLDVVEAGVEERAGIAMPNFCQRNNRWLTAPGQLAAKNAQI
jgi:hypothetical protein